MVGLVSSRRGPGSRILGGYEATPFVHRHMVAIYEEQSFKCGGNLVRANVVLTAAHCMEGAKIDYRVKVNRHNLTQSDSSELKQRVGINGDGDLGECLTFKIKSILTHPRYYRTEEYAKNDLALVFIDRKSSAQGILLDVPNAYHVGELGTIIGWGRPNRGIPKPSQVLMETQVPIIEQHLCEKCHSLLVQGGIELCAGFPDGSTDASRGDSGGPLLIIREEGPVLVGITSWSSLNEDAYCATVYVRISAFHDWIINHLN